jgi:hypothetical protein
MNISLALFEPPHFKHAAVFDDVIELYRAVLVDLGHQVALQKNRLSRDRLNIVFAYQFLPYAPALAQFRYVVCQLEVLGEGAGWYSNRKESFRTAGRPVLQTASAVWDYSLENLAVLESWGIRGHHIPLGYHQVLERVPPRRAADIDVLFYGSMSPVRRQGLMAELQRRCRAKWVFGVYGRERDELIARSRIALNVHVDDHSRVLEQVRVSYLLNNGSFVLSESCASNPYSGGLVELPYPQLAEGAEEWLSREDERKTIAARGVELLKAQNMRGRIQAALAEIA